MATAKQVFLAPKRLRRSPWLIVALVWASILQMTSLAAQVSLDFFGGTNTNAIHLTGKSPIRLTPRINTVIGIQSAYCLSDRWALNLAAQYVVSGYGDAYYNPVSTASSSPVAPTTDFRFHYFALSPKANFDLSPHFKLTGGVYAAYLLKSYIREVNSGTWAPLAFGNFFSDWDFGLVTGFSMEYHRVFFFANYRWGIYPLASFNYTGPDGVNAGVARMYNRTFQVGIGYSILKGRKTDEQ